MWRPLWPNNKTREYSRVAFFCDHSFFIFPKIPSFVVLQENKKGWGGGTHTRAKSLGVPLNACRPVLVRFLPCSDGPTGKRAVLMCDATMETKKGTKNTVAESAIPSSPPKLASIDISSLPLRILGAILDALDNDVDFGACVSVHSCFRTAAHNTDLYDARRLRAWTRQGALRLAAQGNTGALEALADCDIALCRSHLVAAAAGGHLNTVAWLYARDLVDDTDINPLDNATALDAAAANGHANIVRFLHEKDDGTQKHGPVATTAAMDDAAEHGHLHVVAFLDRHRSEGCTERAMDWAAFYGHIAVVALLDERRSEGCTKWAMDAAAANGHLRVVVYLDQHRREGCTTAAMDGAAAEGHLDVFAYLYRHRTEGCTENALLDAQVGDHWDVVDFIGKHKIKPGRLSRRTRRGAPT